MTAGKLAAAKPAATTNTTLYKSYTTGTASVVLQVCNQSASATSYRAALRDYDAVLTYASATPALKKGNIFSDYLITVSPSIQGDTIDPGDVITEEDDGVTFKYHDIFKPTSIITYPIITKSVGLAPITTTSQVGPGFDLEATLTGFDTGLTATYYGTRTGNQIVLNIPSVSSSATSLVVSSDLNAANDLICFANEIALVGSRTGYTLTITRAQYGTTAVSIPAGTPFIGLTPEATTTVNEGATFSASDTILTVTSSADMNVGDYIRIDNEFLFVDAINGNDVTVTRAVLGTTAATHTDGATVTPYITTNSGLANFFALTETLDDGVATTIDLNFTGTYTQSNKFLIDRGEGFEFPNSFGGDIDRIIRFDLSDSTMTGQDFRLSTTADGIHALPTAGVPYTTGVTTSGTPGSSGAYLQVDLSYANASTLTALYPYNAVTAEFTNSQVINIIQNPFYDSVFIYDLDGSLQVDDSFLIGTTQYTITAIKPGPYGYIMNTGTSTSVKASYGLNSPSFPVGAAPTTTITGSSGATTITVGSASSLVVGMRVSGTGIASGAYITNIVGTTVTLSDANTGAVSGTGTFTYTFSDSPLADGTDRTLLTVTSTAVINDEDYIFYDKSISGNSSDKNSGIVVGPGNSLMVYSTANTLSYVVTGFEDLTTDFDPIYYIRQRPQ